VVLRPHLCQIGLGHGTRRRLLRNSRLQKDTALKMATRIAGRKNGCAIGQGALFALSSGTTRLCLASRARSAVVNVPRTGRSSPVRASSPMNSCAARVVDQYS